MRRLLAGALGVAIASAFPAAAQAATIAVTTTADQYGSGGACSLREAVRSANANLSFGGCVAGQAGSLDEVRLAALTYTLTRAGSAEGLNAKGDLDADTAGGPLRVAGPAGSEATIDAAFTDRALDVKGNGSFRLARLRVVNGSPPLSERGGGLRWKAAGGPGALWVSASSFSANTALPAGGAIDVDTRGVHTIESSSFTSNSSGAGTIRSTGELRVRRSLVSGNVGGGIGADGTLELTASTVSGHDNSDTRIGGVLAAGDALIERSTISDNVGGFSGGVEATGGSLTVRFSTIAENGSPHVTTSPAGGIDASAADSLTLDGAIVAGNVVPGVGEVNCDADASPGPSPSLEGADTCGLEPGSGSLVATDPQLAPLALNGGPTPTRGLYPGSPALDAAARTCTPATDQRGVARPGSSPACDIGAFEGSVPLPLVPPAVPPATSPATAASEESNCRRVKDKLRRTLCKAKRKCRRKPSKPKRTRCLKKAKRAYKRAQRKRGRREARPRGTAGALARSAARLKIRKRLIPYPASRQAQMAAYSKRHYGEYESRLLKPKLIVIHYAVAASIGSIYNTFASNRPDPEYGERPGVCSHYAIGSKGQTVRLVPDRLRCRHVVGLNHVALGVEHVGFSDGDVLGNKRELRASLRLVRRLRCRNGIPIKRVIGHNESLRSRFYRELDPRFRGRTHGDFPTKAMRVYRRALRRLGPC